MPLYRVTMIQSITYEAVVRASSPEEAREHSDNADPLEEPWCENAVDRDISVEAIDEADADGEEIIDVSDDEEAD
jgi:hypothetical protein